MPKIFKTMANEMTSLEKARKSADAAGDVVVNSFKDAGMGAVRKFDLNVITEGSTVTVPEEYEIRTRTFGENGTKAAYVFTEEGQQLYVSVFTRRCIAVADNQVYTSTGEVVDAIQEEESLDEAFANLVAGHKFLFAKKTEVETRFGKQNVWHIITDPEPSDYEEYGFEAPAGAKKGAKKGRK